MSEIVTIFIEDSEVKDGVEGVHVRILTKDTGEESRHWLYKGDQIKIHHFKELKLCGLKFRLPDLFASPKVVEIQA